MPTSFWARFRGFVNESLTQDTSEASPQTDKRRLNYRPDLAPLVSRWNIGGSGERKLLSLLRGHPMKMLLRRMLDESEFLSRYGIRALSLQNFHHYYGEDFKVECPTGSGRYVSIDEVAQELSQRLVGLFVKNDRGLRPVFGHYGRLQGDPHFADYLHFYGYFHGDTGLGVGASHQTGWTGLVARLLQPTGQSSSEVPKTEEFVGELV
ncbi:MAG: hypothetical protein ACJ746_07415 [Bryobacteraceae bacterium]